MPTSTLTRKGQTTIPGEIRRHLKLKPGDRIEFVVERDGRVSLVPANVDILAYKGILGPARRRASLEEMDAAIRKGAARTMRK